MSDRNRASFNGSKVLNSGAMNTGSTAMMKTAKSIARHEPAIHHRRPMRRMAAYRTTMRIGCRTIATRSAFPWSPIQSAKV